MIANPIFPYPDVAQSRLSADIVVLQGVAQRVLKIKMREYGAEGFIGAKLPSLLKEVVIGPSDSPLILKDALVQTLREMNVLEPENRVRFTDIPLRR